MTQEETGVKHIRVASKKFEDGEWWYIRPSGKRERVESHLRKNDKRMFVGGKYIPQDHPLWKSGNYKTFDEAAFSSLKNYQSSTEGEVYIITNPAWKGWIKVGMAVDSQDRCNGYQTSSPMRDYKLEYSKHFNNRRTAEFKAHKLCSKQAKDRNGEWFKISVKEAKNVIETITQECYAKETS
jgi:hypothetical protein